MLIKPITEVYGIHFELSVEEAVKFLQDASKMQHEVRVMLRASGVDPETGEATHILIKADREAHDDTEPEMALCPYCGETFKKRGLKRHMGSCPENPDNQILAPDELNPEEAERLHTAP